jgi:hypothetical protein
MPYAFQYDVPADEEFYRRVAAEIGDEQPKGVITHLVVKSDRGLRHIGVWDSKEDWERFHSERVGPALERVFAAVGVTHVPPLPPEQELDLVDALLGG